MKTLLAVLLFAVATLTCRADKIQTETLFSQPIAMDQTTIVPNSIGIGLAICDFGCFGPVGTQNLVFGQVGADSIGHTFTLDRGTPDFNLIMANMCNGCNYYYVGAPTIFPYFSFVDNGQTQYVGNFYGFGTEKWDTKDADDIVQSFTITVDPIKDFEANPYVPGLWEARAINGSEAFVNFSISGPGIVPEPGTWGMLLCGLGFAWLAKKVRFQVAD